MLVLICANDISVSTIQPCESTPLKGHLDNTRYEATKRGP